MVGGYAGRLLTGEVSVCCCVIPRRVVSRAWRQSFAGYDVHLSSALHAGHPAGPRVSPRRSARQRGGAGGAAAGSCRGRRQRGAGHAPGGLLRGGAAVGGGGCCQLCACQGSESEAPGRGKERGEALVSLGDVTLSRGWVLRLCQREHGEHRARARAEAEPCLSWEAGRCGGVGCCGCGWGGDLGRRERSGVLGRHGPKTPSLACAPCSKAPQRSAARSLSTPDSTLMQSCHIVISQHMTPGACCATLDLLARLHDKGAAPALQPHKPTAQRLLLRVVSPSNRPSGAASSWPP